MKMNVLEIIAGRDDEAICSFWEIASRRSQ